MAEATDRVRLLIADLDSPPILTNEQIGEFLAGTNDRVYLAAADALEAIAVSELLLSKKIRTQDLQTDGAGVAAELRALAARYRRRQAEDDEDGGEWSGFSLSDVGGRVRPEHSNHEVWGL